IPVWYNKTTNEIHCEVEPPKDIENWNQEEDVLDTWASSWLWAQDVFTNDKDQNYYYPTDLLVTGPDIIFFWVARMIIAGMEFHKKIPFKDVYFTSIIRDMQGRKLSKSLGNSPDPFNVIAEYGADALRFTINYISPLGQDVMFSTDKCEIGRNFANKIWNAGRFLLMNAEKIKINDELKNKHIDAVDEWLDSKFNRTLKQIDFALDTFDLNGATKLVYSYVWSDFCDWYIEFIKNKLYSNDEELKSASLTRALEHFENLLKIVHPFMPFITEEIWHLIKTRNEKESISTSQFPILNELKINEKIENEIEFLKDVITALRTIRSEMNLAPSAKITAFLKTNQISIQQEKFIKSLARFEKLVVDPNIEKPKGSASSIVRGCDIFVPLEGLIDIEIERNRIEKEIKRLEGMLIGVEKKLANEDFVKRAPKEIIEKEQQKKEHWNESLQKLNFILNDLK
ncbi:MAG: class I tRNA ligase family protein, partial [Ignavibacteriales bacterium]|nr:class I tRNA ligase family protein [Ignavibacteriales bacterium]